MPAIIPGMTLDGGASASPQAPPRTTTGAAPSTNPNANTPAVSPIPVIPGADEYAQADVMATNAYNTALARLNQNRLNTLSSYGYTGKVDPTTGVLSGVGVDPHSMTGQLQQMLHQQAIDDRSAQFAAEDHGLVGGLANQAQSELRFGHAASDAALGSDLQTQLTGLDTQQQDAATTRDNTLWQDEQSRLQAEQAAEQAATIQDLLNQFYGGGDGSGGSTDNTPPPPGPAAAAKAQALAGTLPAIAAQIAKQYNPNAYVPGGSSKKVSTAIQTKGGMVEATKTKKK